MLFSGGSLLAGSAGRTDLAGAAFTDRLTADQFASVRRLAGLDPATVLLPTHGAGSFCTASAARGDGFTTVGHECATNPALQDAEPLAFAARQLAGLLRYPTYYHHMAPINRAGPEPLGTLLAPPALTPGQLAALHAAGVRVVDGRPRAAFAAGHVPGAVNVELDDSFGTYVGWLLPFDAPLALVLDGAQDVVEAVRQLARIGFDRVRGVLRGVDAWVGDGRPLDRFDRASVRELRAALAGPTPPLVLDVRQPAEWREGVIAGSVQRFVADLAEPAAWLPAERPAWVICRSGHRASIGASLLAAAGIAVVAVDGGGVPDVLRGR
jgi:hydroxyacylglutathione hydrolase